jgi:hypothetical protein
MAVVRRKMYSIILGGLLARMNMVMSGSLFFFFFNVIFGIKFRALYGVGKGFTSELYPWPILVFLKVS